MFFENVDSVEMINCIISHSTAKVCVASMFACKCGTHARPQVSARTHKRTHLYRFKHKHARVRTRTHACTHAHILLLHAYASMHTPVPIPHP